MKINKVEEHKSKPILKMIDSHEKRYFRCVRKKSENSIPLDRFVYIDRIKLQSQLLKMESIRSKDCTSAINKIYEIFNDTIDREKEKRRFFSDIRVKYGDLVTCFGDSKKVPMKYVKLNLEKENKVIINI